MLGTERLEKIMKNAFVFYPPPQPLSENDCDDRKDAVRIPRLLREYIEFYFLRMEIDILSGQENFDQYIKRICYL